MANGLSVFQRENFGRLFAFVDLVARLKICPNHGCRWVFYDETRGNTRRWCDDRSCGNRDKVRRLRERRRKQEG